MKPIYNDLHRIISQLTSEEKRLFKQELTAEKKQTQAAQLFSLLESMKNFDVAAYEKFIARKKMQTSAASVKSQLKERLINWVAQHSKAPSGTDIFMQIAVGETLMRFELYDEATIQFEQLRKTTNEIGIGMYEYTVLTYLSTLAQTMPPEKVMPSMIELSQRATEIGKKIYNMSRTLNFYIRTITIYYECRSTAKATHQAMVEQLSREHFISDSDEYVPMEQAIYIFYARSLIYQMKGNLQQAYLENNKLYKRILEFEEKFRVHQPHEYAINFREKLYNCIIADNVFEYENLYQPLYEKTMLVFATPDNYELRLKALHLLYLIKSNKTQQLKADLHAMQQHKKSDHYQIQTAANKKEALMYQGYGYMHLMQYQQAINTFEELISMKVKDAGSDYDNTARFMIMLCRYASIFTESKKALEEPSAYLENTAKALYEYYLKNRIEFPVEKICLKYFQQMAKGHLITEQKSQTTKFLKQLTLTLNEPEPYYLLQIAEFNWPAWLIKHTRT